MGNTLLVPKWCDNVGSMGRRKKNPDEDNSQNRTIRMDKDIWALLDKDSDRCGRSSNKQIEAILRVYFREEDVELMDLDGARNTISPHLLTKEDSKPDALGQKKESRSSRSRPRRGENTEQSYEVIPQTRLFSDGTGKPVAGKKLSRKILADIEDATNDAIERTRKKLSSPKG